jgi:pimeloyl-ACP methyl ester carboxylesterase
MPGATRADEGKDKQQAAELREASLHGHPIFYRCAGTGPVVVLVHGIASTSETWAKVFPYLAEHCTVIAPDLLGHGESAKPRGDY